MTAGVLARTQCATWRACAPISRGSPQTCPFQGVSNASPLASGKDAQAVVENPAPVIFDFDFCDFLSAIGRKFDEWKEKENVTESR